MKKVISLLVCLTLVCSLSVNALAMEFTPSAESKPAPEIVGIVGEDGETHQAIRYDKNNTVIGYLDSGKTIQLVITASSERDQAPVSEIKNMIDVAEVEIKAAKNVGELAPSMVSQLNKLKSTSSDPAVQALEIEDFVVSNYFDISLLQNGKEIKQIPEGETLKFCLKTDLRPGDVFYVLVNCDGLGWVLVDSAVVDENGVVTIIASSLCCMAFIRPGYGLIGGGKSGSKEPKSPQTGAPDFGWHFVVGGAILAVGIGCALSVRKKKEERN